jgi:ATP-dependent Lon protease
MAYPGTSPPLPLPLPPSLSSINTQHHRSHAENHSISRAKPSTKTPTGSTTVKDHILDFLAVGKLRGTVQGKIICLVGPPGGGQIVDWEEHR